MTTPLAAESTHWYAKDGTPCYTVKAKAGHDRPTTLADARKMGLLPSVTSIIRLAAAPGLERWKLKQVALSCLTLPRIPDESEDDFLARAEKDAQEEGKAAAERGTLIHAAIEQHYLGEPHSLEFSPWVVAAVAEIEKLRGPWKPEKSFASPLGYGGKVDLHSGEVVLDIKTKDGGDNKLWPEHEMQLAAYREGLNVPGARAGILFVDRTTPKAAFVEASQDDLQRGWNCFQALLAYHRAKHRYCP